MGLIPNDIIQKVIEASDIVEIIGHTTALKKAGRNFKALCPFHHEKTPSFAVNPDKQIFHCFGCGAGGNVIGFVMRQERMEFPEAVRFLANKAGIPVPEEPPGQGTSSRQWRDEIYSINALAADFFHEELLKSRKPEAEAARDYLKGRGVNLETVRTFRLGLAPKEWDALLKHLKSKGLNEELIAKAGLAVAREEKRGFYDRFRNRIIFPIADVQGRPVAFGARALKEDDGAKYINSPETAVYTKGQHLFGLSLTKTAVSRIDQVLVVEGYMDMIMPYVHGVENIAASLGTALTVDQIRLVRRYSPNVVMLFDTDPAGQSAIVRSLDLLIEEGMNVKVATLAEGQDPDSFIRKHGADAFQRRLEGAQSILDFKLEWLSRQHDPSAVEGKTNIAQEMLATIGRFKSEVAKYELTRLLARKLDVPEQVLLKQAGGRTQDKITPSQPEAETPIAFSAAQELLLALFLKDAAWVKVAQEHLGPEDFPGGHVRHVVDLMWTLTQEAHEWSAHDLLIRLNDDPAQSLVTRLIHIEEGKLADPARVFTDCVDKIRKEKQKKARFKILEAIRRAEASQNTEELDKLKEQFNQLLKAN